ncbi:MAG: hypothetical protein HRF51_10230 [bacterium]|jgi:hypothetical protein
MNRRPAVGLLLLILLFAVNTAVSGRLYGNVAFYYQHVDESNQIERQDDLTRESILLNYEDDLFVKNWIRLAANLDRQEFSYTNYHQFRPIFYFDLKSYGYLLNFSYSPYRRLTTTPAGGEPFYLYYRNWRGGLHINYPDYPSLSLIFNQTGNYDKEVIRRYDGRSRNFVAESIYQKGAVSLRANYNNLTQSNFLPGGKETVTRTYSGSAGVTEMLGKVGNFSATYNYYQTDRLVDDIRSQRSRTHSATALFSSYEFKKLSLSAAYSGRFIEVLERAGELDAGNQNISAQAGLAPTGYLNFQLTKSYQISDEGGENRIVEYISYGAGLSRYFRSGVDSRLSFNRTVYQQSDRLITLTDTVGNTVAVLDKSQYALDNYFFSFSFKPYYYMRTYVDFSVMHNSDPIDDNSRYQSNGSVDTRLTISRKMEGRVGFTSLYQGAKLRLGRSYSQNFNLGLSYNPRPNLNLNLTYIYSEFNVGSRNSSGAWNGYISYSFRRAFSFYFAFNSQRQAREEAADAGLPLVEKVTRPRTFNLELVTYLSRQITLITGYLYSRTEYPAEGRAINRSLQMNLNIKI